MNIQDRVNELVLQSGISLSVAVSTNLVGRSAGDCDGYGRKIRINKVLVSNSDLAAELDETIIHEVAHAVDIQRNGYRRDSRGRAIHHDAKFYDIMAELSGKPAESFKRTHDIKELKPTRIYRRFKYTCDIEGCKDTHILKTPSHNKLQKGHHSYYTFRDCGGKIFKNTFVKEMPKCG